ncbi:MAG: 16S rRNA (cytidine(1402)-2'-O)-methyltransferase [Planctomycetes bacterium]|nr:16S rRNA (cytidine(1402)-2'-O)-methyltransferase [Planctomycetota bacterium]
MTGTLYLVSTPIGNLEDITLRALRILKEVDRIACEDTRITHRLLEHYHIAKPLISYFEHNKSSRSKQVIETLQGGENVALVSNAGTPLVSDPGYELVRQAIANNINVVAIPGASAVLGALAVAGLPTDRFVFEGFLPLKTSKRKKRLAALRDEKRTIVLYESPYRIHKTLEQLKPVIGNRTIALTRELTKFYEEIIRGTVDEIIEALQGKKVKGEITLVISGCDVESV